MLESIPMPTPVMIVVAGPVSEARTMAATGRRPVPVKYSVMSPMSAPPHETHQEGEEDLGDPRAGGHPIVCDHEPHRRVGERGRQDRRGERAGVQRPLRGPSFPTRTKTVPAMEATIPTAHRTSGRPASLICSISVPEEARPRIMHPTSALT